MKNTISLGRFHLLFVGNDTRWTFRGIRSWFQYGWELSAYRLELDDNLTWNPWTYAYYLQVGPIIFGIKTGHRSFR